MFRSRCLCKEGKMRVRWAVCVAFVYASICQAQISSSALNGTVTDATGSVVPRASVTVTSISTGYARSVLTGDNGTYVITDVPPGNYEVSAEAAGFKKAVISNVRLYVGQAATTDIHLEVGQVTDSVLVTSSAPLLQESSS